MFRAFQIPISWGEVFKRTVKETIDDDAMGLAAQMAYYFFLALFPALLCLIALLAYLPTETVMPAILGSLSRFAPPDVLQIVRDQIAQIASGDSGGLLTIGFLGALWSSSVAMVSIVGTLNKAFEIEESRPWWKVRLTAIALTLALAVFMVLSFVLVVAGPQLADTIAERVGLGEAFRWTWKIVQWPIAFLLVSTAVGLVYYFGPDAEQDWVWLTPGAVLATFLWLLASLGFRFYVVNFGSYNETYGTIGGVIVLMLWFYISGLALVVGAEMASEIERASPHAQALPKPEPGHRKKIGLAARRAYEDMRGRIGLPQAPPAPPARPASPVPQRHLEHQRPTVKDVLISAPVLLVSLFGRRKSAASRRDS